jgi:hypothetical protein
VDEEAQRGSAVKCMAKDGLVRSNEAILDVLPLGEQAWPAWRSRHAESSPLRCGLDAGGARLRS